VNKLLIPWPRCSSGLALLVVAGTGLLFAAIGAQAGNAKFSGLVTGLVMSAYFAGFVYGTYACPAIIRRVGHIRRICRHGLDCLGHSHVPRAVDQRRCLGVLRFVGRGVPGRACTSWWRAGSTWWPPRPSAARCLRRYMAVSGVSMAMGQWLILVGDRFGFVPFALVSILFSLCAHSHHAHAGERAQAMETPQASCSRSWSTSHPLA